VGRQVTRRSVHGPAIILILLGFGASFVGTTPRSESQPGSPVIPAATAVAPSQGPVRELVASGNTAETQSKAPGSKASEQPKWAAAMTSLGPRLTHSTAKVSPAPKPPSHRPAATRQPPVPVAVSAGRYVRVTWYCGNGSRCTRGYAAGGLYAAISPDLSSWTGRLVRVTYAGRSVTVRIIDCNCQAEHAIDLYAAAFSRLAPLSMGQLYATVEVQ